MLVKARVKVTLELNCDSCWEDVCSVQEIRRQAKQDIDMKIRKLGESHAVVGKHKVTIMLLVDE